MQIENKNLFLININLQKLKKKNYADHNKKFDKKGKLLNLNM